MKPIIIGMVGSPGAGKSYFSEKISRDLHFAHLRSDDFRFRLISEFKKPDFSVEENDTLFGFLDFLSNKFLDAGVSVIYDANLIKRVHRDRIKKIADDLSARHLILWVQTPIDLAVERAQHREFRPISREVVELIIQGFEEPSSDEQVFIIDGTKTYDEQRDMLLEKLQI